MDSGCDNIQENDYTVCAGIPLEQCGLESAKKEDNCNSNCFKLECTYLDNFGRNLSGLQSCLPSFMQKERFEEVCLNENSTPLLTQTTSTSSRRPHAATTAAAITLGAYPAPLMR